MADHAKYAPSSLGMFDRCPSFENSDDENEAAASGTRCHEAMETGKDDGLTEGELASVKWCRKEQTSLLRPSNMLFGSRKWVKKEVRINILSGLTFGTVDFVSLFDDGPSRLHHDPLNSDYKNDAGEMRGGERMVVMDYKFGKIPVAPVSDNLQMKAYTVGLFETFPNVLGIQVSLLQPFKDWVSTYYFTRRDHYEKIKSEVKEVIVRAQQNVGKEFTPDPDVCQYCANNASCPAISETASSATGMPVYTLDQHMSTDELSDTLDATKVLKKWIKDVEAFAKEKIHQEGWGVRGYQCELRAPGERIVNYAGVDLLLEEQDVLIDRELFNNSFTISKSKLERAIRNANEDLVGDELKAVLIQLYEEMSSRGFIITADTGDEDGTVVLSRVKEPENNEVQDDE